MPSHNLWTLRPEMTLCILYKIYIIPMGTFYQHVLTLTHWGRVTHICVSELTIIGSDNGLSPGRHQAIIWTNAGIMLIRTSGTNFSEILGKTHSFSFKKMHLKMSSAKGRLFSLGLNELIPAWICNYTLRKVWVEITNPFPNLNGATFNWSLGMDK